LSLRQKMVIANVGSLIIPLIIYSVVVSTKIFDNAIVTLLYLAHIVIPLFLLLITFREDSLMQGYPSKIVFWRTLVSCTIWLVAVGGEVKYSQFIDAKIIPSFAIRLFTNVTLPPLVPEMNYLLPMYEPMFIGFGFVYCTVFLTVAVCISHCKTIK
jgi:hypothetical protein